MGETIAQIILIGSFIGMGIILYRKIPVLAKLPEVSFKREENLFLRIKNKIKEIIPLKSFSYEILLQKILSKIRILSLKTDNKIANWLQKLREKSQKKKFEENDNYWQKIKKSINLKGKRK
ncbi:MAG: hypothetical protein QME61_03000 [Patescibacteria group bacterium]|nr:hypothetical protein [Patescibacteria group bacterium]